METNHAAARLSPPSPSKQNTFSSARIHSKSPSSSHLESERKSRRSAPWRYLSPAFSRRKYRARSDELLEAKRWVASLTRNARGSVSPASSCSTSPGGSTAGSTDSDELLAPPEHTIFCRDCQEQAERERRMAEGQEIPPGTLPDGSDPSPLTTFDPHGDMDQNSLAFAMDANRESLKKRLLLRRSVTELMDQGIYPSLKSPAQFVEQGLRLQRAQMGDKLKQKIERRPDRDFLVAHHILEDSKVDPSLAERQRQLKKAQLTDELNEKIAYRPGPLELVEHNILEADDPIKHAIREGKIGFHKAEDGLNPVPVQKVPYEVESPKSGHSSPEPAEDDNDSNNSSSGSTGFQPASAIPSPPDITPLLRPQTHITIGGKTIPVTTTQSFLSHRPITQFPAAIAYTSTLSQIPSEQRQSNFGATKPSYRQKRSNKNKSLSSKQRVIKFHEYKGPSSKSSSSASSSTSGGLFVTTVGPEQDIQDLSPYELRLQQQQLYLQCQLEVASHGMLPMHQQVMMPTQTHFAMPENNGDETMMPMSPPLFSQPGTPAPSVGRGSSRNLDDMKVADLRSELKQRGLTVSGPKPQLIERLKTHVSQSGDDYIYRATSPPSSPLDDAFKSPPSSVASSNRTVSESEDTPNPCVSNTANILREQQKKIEELQRELMLSQQRLQMASQQPVRMLQTNNNMATIPNMPKLQQQQPPVDITDKQVYLATPDGKMTAFKVVLHTGNGFKAPPPRTASASSVHHSPVKQNEPPTHTPLQQLHSQPSFSAQSPFPFDMSCDTGVINGQAMSVPISNGMEKDEDTHLSTNLSPRDHGPASNHSHPSPSEPGSQETCQQGTNLGIDDVLEALISTGEIDSHFLSSRTSKPHPQNPTSDISSDIGNLSLPSPLSGMDWMDSETSNQTYNNQLDQPLSNDFMDDSMNCMSSGQPETHDNLEWLSGLDIPIDQNNGPTFSNNQLYNNTMHCEGSTMDPVLTQKSSDVLKIFDLEDTGHDFRISHDPSVGFNWDKLGTKTSH